MELWQFLTLQHHAKLVAVNFHYLVVTINLVARSQESSGHRFKSTSWWYLMKILIFWVWTWASSFSWPSLRSVKQPLFSLALSSRGNAHSAAFRTSSVSVGLTVILVCTTFQSGGVVFHSHHTVCVRNFLGVSRMFLPIRNEKMNIIMSPKDF